MEGRTLAERERLNWPEIVKLAAEIVRSYDTGVTLRQLFYRLVAAEVLPNSQSAYKGLSSNTAEARRRGEFPDLIDRTRRIHRWQTFHDPAQARDWLSAIYRRDRTEGQHWSVYVGVEKAGIVEQLTAWFSDMGIPILALGGYSSQSYVDVVAEDVKRQRRPAVLIYGGDFDPSGEDIDRDFLERVGCFGRVERVALHAEQIQQYNLPPQPGKSTDARAAGFIRRHGELMQVELDALPPDVLRELYRAALDAYWDVSAYESVVKVETRERRSLTSTR